MFDNCCPDAYNIVVNQYYISNAKEKAFKAALQKKLPWLRAVGNGNCQTTFKLCPETAVGGIVYRR